MANEEKTLMLKSLASLSAHYVVLVIGIITFTFCGFHLAKQALKPWMPSNDYYQSRISG